MPYTAPIQEHLHLLRNVLGFNRVSATEKFGESGDDMVEAILTEAAKMAQDVLAPLQRPTDLHPAHLENGVVRTAPGVAQGYKAIAEGGWVGAAADPEHGGMGLPLTVTTCVGEMMSSACLSLSLNPLMTQGQIEALEAHGSEEIKALYLPKLISGEWTGTMNLTEPQAGSDVGALRSKATDNGDGTFAVTGQKIFISWGDHDFGGNVCHLVLARLPDGVPGTKGISLFIVPKFIPNPDGSLGEANSLRVISLEHKLGLHGSPTAIMEFDGATGWMVGPPHGGMAAMFTMMNNARLGVGTEGLGVAEAAYQKALEFALDRKQGKTPVEGTGTIADHADVRRMLITMKAQTTVARAIILDTAISTDLASATGDASMKARAALLTPIAKAFGTDTGSEVADMGVQVHGGMGFIEETGAAQFARDVRVTRIYEGTNGIQAMDLVGRKLMDGGTTAYALLDEIKATAADHSALAAAEQEMRACTEKMLSADTINDRFAGATAYLRAFALTLGGHYLLRAATDQNRQALADYYAAHFLPQIPALCASATAGDHLLYALDAEALAG